MNHFYPKIPTGAQISTQRPTLKGWFWTKKKKSADDKKHEKLPSRQLDSSDKCHLHMKWLITIVDSYQQFVYIVLIFVLVQYIKSSSHWRHYVLLSLFTIFTTNIPKEVTPPPAWGRGVTGSRLTGDIVVCSWARHFILCLVLVQPRKCPNMTEKLLTGT